MKTASERGFGLLTVLGGAAVMVMMLAAAVFLYNTQARRTAQSAEALVRQGGEMVGVLTRASLGFSEACTALRAEDFPAMAAALSASVESGSLQVELEDESAKVNLHSMAYALTHLLMGPLCRLDSGYAEPLVNMVAEQQGLILGRNRSGVAYPWRPPALLSLMVEPTLPAPPYDLPKNRHMMVGRAPFSLDWKPLEAPEDLLEVWGAWLEDDDYKRVKNILPYLTTYPTLGVNVNTASQYVIDALMTWQRDAWMGHPRHTRAWDALIFDVPFPTPYTRTTDRLYRGIPFQQGSTSALMLPKFGDGWKLTAQAVVNGRAVSPYAFTDVLQPLAFQSFLFPLGFQWHHFSGPATEAVHVRLSGPGPYSASSAGFFTLKFRGRSAVVTATFAAGGGGLKILKWREEL